MPFDAKAYAKEYRAKNRERLCANDRERAKTPERKAQAAAYRKTDARREWKRQWALKNPDKIKAMKRRDYLKHKPAYVSNAKKRYNENPKEWYERVRAWKLENPEKEAKYQEIWRDRNRKEIRVRSLIKTNRRRAIVAKRQFDSSADLFIEHVRKQEWVNCLYCGKKIHGASCHIDHKLAIARGGNHMAENLAVSCRTCNLSKGVKTLDEWQGWKKAQQTKSALTH